MNKIEAQPQRKQHGMFVPHMVTNKSRSGRPVEFDYQALDDLLHVNLRQTSRELDTRLNYSHMTVNYHLRALGKVNKYGDSVPRQLSTDDLAKRVSICSSLMSRQNHDPFL